MQLSLNAVIWRTVSEWAATTKRLHLKSMAAFFQYFSQKVCLLLWVFLKVCLLLLLETGISLRYVWFTAVFLIYILRMKPQFRRVEELMTAIHLHSVVLAFRLYKGDITAAVDAGFLDLFPSLQSNKILRPFLQLYIYFQEPPSIFLLKLTPTLMKSWSILSKHFAVFNALPSLLSTHFLGYEALQLANIVNDLSLQSNKILRSFLQLYIYFQEPSSIFLLKLTLTLMKSWSIFTKHFTVFNALPSLLSTHFLGYEALQLANIVNDLKVKVAVIPFLAQSLLLLSR